MVKLTACRRAHSFRNAKDICLNLSATKLYSLRELYHANIISPFSGYSFATNISQLCSEKKVKIPTSGNAPASLHDVISTSGNIFSHLESVISTSGNAPASLQDVIPTSGNIFSHLESVISTSGNAPASLQDVIPTSGNIFSK